MITIQVRSSHDLSKQLASTDNLQRPNVSNDLDISDTKRHLFKAFLRRLAEDPAMVNHRDSSLRPLSDWIMMTEYPMQQSFEFDEKSGELLPQQRPQIDMAKLLNLLFKQHHLGCTADDLMLHMLQGGTLQSFLDGVDSKRDS